MKYVVEAFNKTTELLAFEVAIPACYDIEVKRIMEWTTEQQGWDGYDLRVDQLIALGKLVGEPFDASAYGFQLSVNSV